MIRVERCVECTPTVALDAAIDQLGRHVQRPLKWDMVLRILPRRTDYPSEANETEWYDVEWAIPCLIPPHEIVRIPQDPTVDDMDEPPDIGWLTIERVGTLPPPPRIPVEERLGAGIPEPVRQRLERTPDDIVRLYGGHEAVLEQFQAEYAREVRQDRSADAYRWSALAEKIIALYQSLTPPKPTPEQRVRYAGARLLQARREVENATASLRHLVRNAYDAALESNDGKPPRGVKSRWAEWAGVSRPTLDSWLPTAGEGNAEGESAT